MSDDLISRKEALQVLEGVFSECRMSWGREHGGFGAAAQEVIEELPAAFDKENVIKELNTERNPIYREDGSLMSNKTYISIDNAIEIVEKGGIE